MAQNTSRQFYFGVDLSYVNEMDDCGAEYRVNGETQDAFTIFANHGASLVRARLWHNPDWTNYSTLADVKRTFQRARDAGMSTLLDFHYSDNWADPGRQEIPKAWEAFSEDVEALANAVYQYTFDTLHELHADNLTPEFVQVGNEINSGMLHTGGEELDWSRQSQVINAGIRAVREFSSETGTSPQIILHVAQPENTGWWFSEAETAGVTDFDIIGLSYYPQWSTFSIADTGAHVGYLRQRFAKEVMIVETAYAWTHDYANESASNILNQSLSGYSFTPEGQLAFMSDLTQAIISNGGLGVIYWEPAWVSTECFTQWGQGSHWENATFFDFNNGNEVLDSINYLNRDYWYPDNLLGDNLDLSVFEQNILDNTDDVLDGDPEFDLSTLYTKIDNHVLHLLVQLEGDIFANRGNYLIYFDTTHDESGATVDVGQRPITVASPYFPEYRLDIGVSDQRGTRTGTYQLHIWNDDEWVEATYTGAMSIHDGTPSMIELQMPLTLLNNPDVINIAVVSTKRGRTGTAGDILGTDRSPSDWSEPVVLDTFFNIMQRD